MPIGLFWTFQKKQIRQFFLNTPLRPLMMTWSIKSVVKILQTNDGSLPDINFTFKGNECICNAYQHIQSLSRVLVSTGTYYWSRSKQTEVPIIFGDNPALKYIEGDAEPFYVVFGGITSRSGKLVPDLGVFILSDDNLALDYRMGEDWNTDAVIGLFEIMFEFESLSQGTVITHEGNFYEENNELISAYEVWKQIISKTS